MSERIAMCPGSFDPVTNGHLSIIQRALRLFDEVVVAVTVNERKTSLFTLDQRIEMIRRSFPNEERLSVQGLEGLLAREARELGAVALVRGLRVSGDFEYEVQMARMNRHLTAELDTVFLAAEASGSYVSSSLVREVASLGGDVSELVPAHVDEALKEILGGRP